MSSAIGGVDHCIVLVRDLAAARETWERLGFRVLPRGLHSARMGTANHTLMLADDYVELLGTVGETEENLRWRDRLSGAGEGLVAIALRLFDAEAAHAELAARGLLPLPLLSFGRSVALAGPGAIEARFEVFHLPSPVSPECRLFFCRHLTPGATWPPGSTEHPNGAVAIESFTIRATDPRAAAEAAARACGRAVTQRDGMAAVETGRARLLFAPTNGGGEGIDEIAVRVRDLDVAAASLEAGGFSPQRNGGALSLKRAETNGVSLRLVRA
ncbi:MAG: VOC family protein [Acetobacteraceae bacterium]|jgi:catechol 2,3-dioxygenase-like lactoylglutathione lyase family enzyme|nr:VOC family protein [Acetobacteraceae bacterium]